MDTNTCKCVWGLYTVDHAMNFPTGGFPILRHNELRDFALYSHVRVEPPLQPLTGETLRFPTANNEGGANVDVSASRFWGSKYQKAFFLCQSV